MSSAIGAGRQGSAHAAPEQAKPRPDTSKSQEIAATPAENPAADDTNNPASNTTAKRNASDQAENEVDEARAARLRAMGARLEAAYEADSADSSDRAAPTGARDEPSARTDRTAGADQTDLGEPSDLADPPHPTPRAMPTMPSLAGQLLKTVLVLGAVCLLAYVVLGRLLPRLLNIPAPGTSRRIIQVVDRLPVDPKRSVMLIKLGERHYLIGVTEHGISLLSQVDEQDVEHALSEAGPSSSVALGLRGPLDGLRNLIRRPPEKNR
ncbi:MAG: flagellar biosynthetic protein FliO [Deltaproteobacteria bacterium]|nr:flagellar biosynthetic protein FliO [Deltaproteobacteria bacterium]